MQLLCLQILLWIIGGLLPCAFVWEGEVNKQITWLLQGSMSEANDVQTNPADTHTQAREISLYRDIYSLSLSSGDTLSLMPSHKHSSKHVQKPL